ncbi:MAG: hypothetical protein ABI164_07035 [Acidobacteriaceae bacterium]
MSIGTTAINVSEHLPKVIGPREHGMIDYANAVFFFGVAFLCRKRNRPAALAALGTGAFVLAQSLLTDYPLGAKPVISFETHGKMDAGLASASWMIPKLFGFSDTKEARIFEVNSAVAGCVVGMTDFNSERARLERVTR